MLFLMLEKSYFTTLAVKLIPFVENINFLWFLCQIGSQIVHAVKTNTLDALILSAVFVFVINILQIIIEVK